MRKSVCISLWTKSATKGLFADDCEGAVLENLGKMHSNPPVSATFTGASQGSLFQSLNLRQIRPRQVRLEYPYSGKWTSVEANSNSEAIENGSSDNTRAPPIALCFTKDRGYGHYLAVADEDGLVNIYNTSLLAPGKNRCPYDLARNGAARWLAHTNAIFDACWIKADTCILTGSGDQTIKVWDVEHETQVGVMKGHTGSVKSLSANPSQSDLFVSGARDGCVAFWDIRTPAAVQSDPEEVAYSSVAKVKDAHKGVTAKFCRRQGYMRSVTSVLYLKDERFVATAGANDGSWPCGWSGASRVYARVVKYWDTRKLKSPVAQTPPAGFEAATPQKNRSRLHGIAGLSRDPTGTRLIATSVDSKIYMYDVLRPEKGALRTFSGHLMGTFYIKATFSPDGSHILSGSSDHNAYIWKVDDPESNPTILEGHNQEVTAVSWCPTDFCKIATCSDDFTVRVWSLNEPRYEERVTKEPHTCEQPFAAETEASPASPMASFELEDEFPEAAGIRVNNNSGVEDVLQTTDTGVLGFGTRHNSRDKELTPSSKRLRVFQISPVEKENIAAEDQQLESPQPKMSFSPSSVLSPPGSISKRRKTIVDYFGLQP